MFSSLCPNCGVKVTNRGYELVVDDIPGELFARIDRIGDYNISSLYICSPFLAQFKDDRWLASIATIAKKNDFHLITRPPNQWESRTAAVMPFYVKAGAKIHFVRDLHAKLYLIGAQELSFAVFGSPNFTNQASKNIEAGIFVTDEVAYEEFSQTFHELARKNELWELDDKTGLWERETDNY